MSYADSIAIVVMRKSLETISKVMKRLLRIVHRWTTSPNSALKAGKTDAELLVRRAKFPACKSLGEGETVNQGSHSVPGMNIGQHTDVAIKYGQKRETFCLINM